MKKRVRINLITLILFGLTVFSIFSVLISTNRSGLGFSNNTAIPTNSNMPQQILKPKASNIEDYNFSGIIVTNAKRSVELGMYGIVSVEDDIRVLNNGSTPVEELYYSIPNKYEGYVEYFGANTESGSTLLVQEKLNRINGHKTYIIYLNEPILPLETLKLKIITQFFNIFETSGSAQSQIIELNFSVYPYVPYPIQVIDTGIRVPDGATLNDFNPESDNITQAAKYYHRTDVPAYSLQDIQIKYTYNTNPTIVFEKVDRKIYVNSWGYIKVVEDHIMHNLGQIPVSSYDFKLLADIQNISAYDRIGGISGATINEFPNSDGKTRNVTMNLIDNRSKLTGNSTVSYTLEYNIPIANFYGQSLRKSSFIVNLNYLKSDMMIISQSVEIYLYGAMRIDYVSIAPDYIGYAENSLVLTYTEQNITSYEDAYLYIEYKTDPIQLSFRGIVFSLIIIGFLSYYVVQKNKEEKTSLRAEVLRENEFPEKEVREFISLYEELNAIRIDLMQLDANLDKKKIAKKAYSRQRKLLESKIKELNEEIKGFKRTILEKGGRIAELVQRLDVKETELLANEDSIKLHKERYRRGKLPSKRAYSTLLLQMERNSEKIQKEIDKTINEIKSFLI
ncbi:MAG: hypothetical protein ACTSU2_14650 [Promethearchaeota archaeon]